MTVEATLSDGTKEIQKREVYNRGNGVSALLFNPKKQTILLIKQLRVPTFLNGNSQGLLIEACAGKLDKDNESPESGILREIEEETGHRVRSVKKIFESYMSPGTVTEILHFYLAEYSEDTLVHSGGGLDAEQERIEVLEVQLSDAIKMIDAGEIKDAKTIMLIQYAHIHCLHQHEGP